MLKDPELALSLTQEQLALIAAKNLLIIHSPTEGS
jgi:hypothetical protein